MKVANNAVAVEVKTLIGAVVIGSVLFMLRHPEGAFLGLLGCAVAVAVYCVKAKSPKREKFVA